MPARVQAGLGFVALAQSPSDSRVVAAVRVRALLALAVGLGLTAALDFLAVRLMTPQLGALLAALTALALTARFVEGTSLRTEGLFPRGSGRQVGAGLLLGGTLSTGTVLLICATGLAVVSWRGTGRLQTPLLLLAGAAAEEIVFRGLLLRLLARATHPVVGAVLSAVLFGLAHLSNEHATASSTLAIAVEAGLLLAAAWFVGRSLWLPTGLHAGWNFMLGPVLGAATSGGPATRSLLAFDYEPGHDLLTGGAFGPEASVLAVALCSVATVALVARVLAAPLAVEPRDRGPALPRYPHTFGTDVFRCSVCGGQRRIRAIYSTRTATEPRLLALGHRLPSRLCLPLRPSPPPPPWLKLLHRLKPPTARHRAGVTRARGAQARTRAILGLGRTRPPAVPSTSSPPVGSGIVLAFAL